MAIFLRNFDVERAQQEHDKEAERLLKTDFFKDARPAAPEIVRKKRSAHTCTAKVQVVKPRVSPDKIAEAKMRDEEKKLRAVQEAQNRAAEAKRREAALSRLADPQEDLRLRIEAAKFLGFIVVFRGPVQYPRRIVFRENIPKNPKRFTYMFPRGKRGQYRY